MTMNSMTDTVLEFLIRYYKDRIDRARVSLEKYVIDQNTHRAAMTVGAMEMLGHLVFVCENELRERHKKGNVA